MLTKIDLSQIRDVVREEVDTIVDKKLDVKLKPIKKDLKYLKKTLDVFIDRTDREKTKLEKRVVRIENHLNISQI